MTLIESPAEIFSTVTPSFCACFTEEFINTVQREPKSTGCSPKRPRVANSSIGYPKELAKVEKTLEDYESEYAQTKKAAMYEMFKAAKDPIMTAVCTREYEVLGHKAVSEDGIVTGYATVNKLKLVDLADFFKKLNGSVPEWVHKTEKLGYLISLRVAKDLKVAADNLAKIKDNYAMSELAKKIELGETPTSNTKTCKALQDIIDGIIFADDGNGKNQYKVCNHDVVYLEHGFMKLGKNAGSLVLPAAKTVQRMIADIAWRVVTNGTYSANGTILKDKA